MFPTFKQLMQNLPAIIGAVGGTIGILSGIAVFARRRLRLVVTLSRNNDADDAWYTIVIANRSDLAVSYRDYSFRWFIMTPLGRMRLNWAFQPEDERNATTLAPHTADTIRIDDNAWDEAMPRDRRDRAYLRMFISIPSRGRGVWLPVHESSWRPDSLRNRFLRRLYGIETVSDFD